MGQRVNSFVTAVVFPLTILTLVIVALGCQPGTPGRLKLALAPLRPVTPLRMPDVAARPRLIVFSASWCGPCQRAKPMVAQLEAAGIEVLHYDIDAQPEMATKYGVTSVPTFFIYQDNKQTFRTQDVAEVLARLTPNP